MNKPLKQRMKNHPTMIAKSYCKTNTKEITWPTADASAEVPSVSSNEMNADMHSETENLANKVEQFQKKKSVKKHKIGGYITEDLYQEVHVVCKALDVKLSDMFQVTFTEFVESYYLANPQNLPSFPEEI